MASRSASSVSHSPRAVRSSTEAAMSLPLLATTAARRASSCAKPMPAVVYYCNHRRERGQRHLRARALRRQPLGRQPAQAPMHLREDARLSRRPPRPRDHHAHHAAPGGHARLLEGARHVGQLVPLLLGVLQLPGIRPTRGARHQPPARLQAARVQAPAGGPARRFDRRVRPDAARGRGVGPGAAARMRRSAELGHRAFSRGTVRLEEERLFSSQCVANCFSG
mmetsp:Transcript_25644/g.59353  ORF Transcript_25644/g.59353 Transcript_25644/m.59353 type:complete len:223 (-) Transcript_25644:194-862(-)